MGQLAAANVTYSLVEGSKVANPANPMLSAVFNVSFGDGTAFYTNGGIPLTKAKLGCPQSIQELYLISAVSNDGYVYKFNYTAETVQIFQALAQTHVHSFTLAGGITTADFVYHNTGVLGKVAATNVTIAGSANNATTGGVNGATLAAAALTELATSAAVSAVTLRMRVVGY